MLVKLPKFAEGYGISRQTALRWFHEGTMPYPAKKVSERIILVDVPDNFPNHLGEEKHSPSGKTVAYMRVSTRGQKDSLPLQKMSILEYVNAHGITVDSFVEEIGSGYNGNRKKLQKVLSDPDVSTIIVEHKDRLIRTNFDILQAALSCAHKKIIVVKRDQEVGDLVSEITEFMVSACGKIYGKRGAERVKQILESEEENLEQ